MPRPTLGYPGSTRGDALGLDALRFVEPVNVDLGKMITLELNPKGLVP
jgi:hypothetical protein